MPNNGLLNIDGKVIDSTSPDEIDSIVSDAVSDAIDDISPTLVHVAGNGTTPEEITGIKDFSYGHDGAQDDNNPSVRAARLRITGQVAPSASQKSVSQVDFYIGNDNVAYMGCTRQNGNTYIKVASNNDSVPLIFGYKPFQDNTACIRFEKNRPVWRGGQTGTYSADKALAVVGDIDTKINARFSVNPLTTNRVLVSDGNGKVSPSTVTTTDLGKLASISSGSITTITNEGSGGLTISSGSFKIINGVCYLSAVMHASSNTVSSVNATIPSLPAPAFTLNMDCNVYYPGTSGTWKAIVFTLSNSSGRAILSANPKLGIGSGIDANVVISYPIADNSLVS